MNAKLLGAIVLAGAAGGCCDQHVEARAFVGHLTEAECARKINEAEPPISIICPGTEVTVCWAAKGVTSVNIDVSNDPGNSGSFGDHGAIHLTPASNTTIDIVASDCASTTKQVQVINGPTPASFDGHWTNSCTQVSYELNPLFVDPLVQTIDVSAEWYPQALDPVSKSVVNCPYPPFLSGSHPEDVHFFEIEKPFLTHAFSRILKGVQHWNYVDKACVGYDQTACNPFASLPFHMTLVCPAKP